MESECSLPRSQEPTTGPYPEPDTASSHLIPYFLKITSNIIIPSTSRFSYSCPPYRFSDTIIVRNFNLPHVLHASPISSYLIRLP
jgi:hypothetical protein